MKTYFYNLAGGINTSATKTELGLDTKKLFWADSKNIEIFQNSGIIKQKGNTLLITLEDSEEIISINQMKKGTSYQLLIATALGNLYVYNPTTLSTTKLTKQIDGSAKLCFAEFLEGVLVASKKDGLFYIKNNDTHDIVDCNLLDSNNVSVKSNAIAIYKGRVWVGSGSTLYYSALGRYDDFTTEDDAGYMRDFYTDTYEITALKPYKDYLAIYKKDSVYLLSGSSAEDFKIVPFADKGTGSSTGVITVNNKQYFINDGVFSLEQTGLLSQIQLGEEITLNIKSEFQHFDKTRMNEIIILHYEQKNQIWFFIPYQNDEFFHTIWIYDYLNQAWFKREVPQDIVSACKCDDYILTADATGKIYKEDFGTTFNGQAIEFLWKTPFLASGDSNIRKTIDEFYFILDETYDNNFNFSVYKNYDSEDKDDPELIYSINSYNLLWSDGGDNTKYTDVWSDDDTVSNWAMSADAVYKAEISESNYSVQLCVDGSEMAQNTAIIGFEFKEIFVDE